MRWDDIKLLTIVPVLFVAIVYLSGCATPPPTQELADAEAAVSEAKAAGCPDCAPEECAAAESALEKGKSLAGVFCSELEARRLLIDAKASALEAKAKCTVVPPPPAMGVEMKDIFFDFDKSNIRADAEPVLQENAQMLQDNPDLSIVIEGYADLRGSVQYNIGLAQRRADSAKAYLVNLGVDESRIEAIGIGETEQFGAGTDEAAYQLNRRAHFTSGDAPGARLIIKRAEDKDSAS